jgi:L-seryl-tRNA(Ser) seleniumtransferase
MRNEVIIQGVHRNMYDRCIELAGGKIVQVGDDSGTSVREYRKAFNERTAAVVYFVYDPKKGTLPGQKVIEIAHEHKVPVIMDAAAELPPVSNLTKFTKMGADLVIFSGGKDIRGPNSTGLLIGKKGLVSTAMKLGPHSYEVIRPKLNPHRSTIIFSGRPMKTSKEDVFGVIQALSEYLEVDHDERVAQFRKRVDRMVRALSGHKSAKVSKMMPGWGQARPLTIPRVMIQLKTPKAAKAVVAGLKENDPPIYVYSSGKEVFINPQCLKDDEVDIVISRLQQLLK